MPIDNIVVWGPTSDQLICAITQDGHSLRVTPGRELECWRIIVSEHNKKMNTKSHRLLDQALQIAARALGKPLVNCAIKD